MSACKRAGKSGVSAILNPNGESAFSIADITAGETGITPASPAPLTPRGFIGEGD
jgi:hypothetical protein